MTVKKVSWYMVLALQAVFTFAYFVGIALIVAFLAVAFVLAEWAAGVVVTDVLRFLSVSIEVQIVARGIALVLVAIPLVKNYKKICAQLKEYWLIIINIKSINN